MNRTTSGLLILVISAAVIAASAWFLYNGHSWMYYGLGRGPISPGMIMGGAMGNVMILFWVALAVALFSLLSEAFAPIRRRSHAESDCYDALEILRQRYARGEIDQAEYETKHRHLDL